jgi:hypothetical protein
MFIVSEVHELWSGHEYSFQSSRNMTQVRFDDVAMTTTLMIQLEEVGIVKLWVLTMMFLKIQILWDVMLCS